MLTTVSDEMATSSPGLDGRTVQELRALPLDIRDLVATKDKSFAGESIFAQKLFALQILVSSGFAVRVS